MPGTTTLVGNLWRQWSGSWRRRWSPTFTLKLFTWYGACMSKSKKTWTLFLWSFELYRTCISTSVGAFPKRLGELPCHCSSVYGCHARELCQCHTGGGHTAGKGFRSIVKTSLWVNPYTRKLKYHFIGDVMTLSWYAAGAIWLVRVCCSVLHAVGWERAVREEGCGDGSPPESDW